MKKNFIISCVLIFVTIIFSGNLSSQPVKNLKQYDPRLYEAMKKGMDPKEMEKIVSNPDVQSRNVLKRTQNLEINSAMNPDPYFGWEGHYGPVVTVAYNKDGTMLASGAYDGTVRLWNVNDGSLIKVLLGHNSCVNTVVFSPDGSKLASGSFDAIHIWNVSDGNLIRTFGTDYPDSYSISFSPDGSKLASGSWNTIHIWNVNDGSLNNTLSSSGESLAFSPDGSMLASAGGYDYLIKLWNANDGSLIRTLSGHTGLVQSAAFSPDGSKLASGSSDNTIKFWNINDGSIISTITDAGYVYTIAFSPDGNKIASGGIITQDVKLWNVGDGSLIRTLTTYSSSYSIAFSPDGSKLASGNHDCTIKILNVSTGVLIKSFMGHTSEVSSVAISADGSKLVTAGDWDGKIKLWNAINGSLMKTLSEYTGTKKSVAFSPDGTKFATDGGSYDNTIKLWNASDGSLIRTFAGHSSAILSVAFSPDGNNLASGSKDSTVKIWDVNNGGLIRTLTGHTGDVNSIKFSPDGSIIASGSADKTIKLWSVSQGNLIRTLTGHSYSITSIAFSFDGSKLASSAGGYDGVINLWNVDDGSLFSTFYANGQVNSLTFSPDKSELASGSTDGTIKIWNIKNSTINRNIVFDHGYARSISFDSSGTKLASGGWGYKNIRIFSVTPLRIPRIPRIKIADNNLHFGIVKTGDAKELMLTITNTGDTTLLVTDIQSSSSEFYTDLKSFTVEKGSTKQLKVIFSPNSAGNKSAGIWIYSNDPDNPTTYINLDGRALILPSLMVSNTALNFGNYKIGTKKDTIITISNHGESALQISSIISSSDEFITDQNSFTIDSLSNKSIKISFVPISAGQKSATLTIFSNDPNSPDTISLQAISTSNDKPLLYEGNVFPSSGHENTNFIFTIIYSDKDNNPPSYINLKIDSNQPIQLIKRDSNNDYTNGVVYQYTATVAKGSHYYSFSASDGVAEALGDITAHAGPTVNISNTAPILSSVNVYPQTGNPGTDFCFSAFYSDADNDTCTSIFLKIDTMQIIPVKVNSSINTEGVMYQYTTKLNLGAHSFSFSAKDWTSDATGDIAVHNEPNVVSSGTEPTLISGNVVPQIGSSDTIFTFSVRYVNKDGLAPSSLNVKIDNNTFPLSPITQNNPDYINGISYQYQTKLSLGTHQYLFNGKVNEINMGGDTAVHSGPIVADLTSGLRPFAGMWTGTTSQGYPVTFSVSDDRDTVLNFQSSVSLYGDITINGNVTSRSNVINAKFDKMIISGNTISDRYYPGVGNARFSGTFNSPIQATGTCDGMSYTFIYIGGPFQLFLTGSGTWQASLLSSITVNSPLDHALVRTPNINVTGCASGPLVKTAKVNDIPVQLSNGTFSVNVLLQEGENTITLAAYDTNNVVVGNHTINVTLDSTPPVVHITDPLNSALINQSDIIVKGTINDPSILSLNINDNPINIINGNFNALVSLKSGSNKILAVAYDKAGNCGRDSVLVTRGDIPVPLLKVSTNKIVFPDRAICDSAFSTVYLRNDSTGLMTIISITTNTGIFSTKPDSMTVRSRDSITLIVKFRPSSFGAFNDTVTVVSNGGTTKIVSIGTCPMPVFTNLKSSISYGSVAKNTTKKDTVKVVNGSINILTVDSIYTKTSAFVVDRISGIVGADTLKIVVSFTPTVITDYTDTVYLHNNSATPLVKIPLSGTAPAPVLSASVNSLSFVNRAKGDSAAMNLYLRNNSITTMTISSVVTNIETFTTRIDSMSVRGLDSLILSVKFKPTSFGKFTDTVKVISDGGTAKISVTGSSPFPVITCLKPSIVYGNVAKNLTKNDTLGVINSSMNLLSVDSIYTKTNAFVVNLTSGTVGTDTLRIVVLFTPTKVGNYTDTVYFQNNSATPLVKIPVSGSAPAPVLVVNPESIIYGIVNRDSISQKFIMITDTSISALSIDTLYTKTEHFTISMLNFPMIVNYKDTLKLILTFKPDSAIAFTDTLYIKNNSNVPYVKIPLSGNGITTSVENLSIGIPKQFELSQNYPNPFNPSTTIRYALPKNSIVRLKIFNILGQMISELVNGEQPAGYKSVIWNAKVSSGLYFYRIEATDASDPNHRFIDTKKMIMLK